MSAGKIVLLVFGVIVLVIAVGLLTTGGMVLWVDNELKDSEGFITTGDMNLEKDSYAIVTHPADIDADGGRHRGPYPDQDWGDLLTIKIEGSNNDPSKGIFMGIAEASDLRAYLSGVEYDEIRDFDFDNDGVKLDYTNHPGQSMPAAPAAEEFWDTSAHGSGEQELEWELETGTYSLVLMNEDGSQGIDLSVRLGAKLPVLFGLGLGLIVGGAVALLIGIIMVAFAVRK